MLLSAAQGNNRSARLGLYGVCSFVCTGDATRGDIVVRPLSFEASRTRVQIPPPPLSLFKRKKGTMSLYSTNHQHLYDQILADPDYDIRIDGTVWARRPLSGVPTHGKVYPFRRFDRKIKNGYWVISYFGKFIKVHKLVYRKFIGPLDPNLTINHKDGIKDNNAPDNLEQISHFANCQHALNNGLFCVGSNMPGSKLNEDQARLIKLLHIRNGMSSYAIWKTKKFPVTRQPIDAVIRLKRWRHATIPIYESKDKPIKLP